MNGFTSKLRQRFSHKMPKKPQHSPYRALKKVYGATAQDTIVPDDLAKLNDDQIKLIQQVIGVCLYYVRQLAIQYCPFSAPLQVSNRMAQSE